MKKTYLIAFFVLFFQTTNAINETEDEKNELTQDNITNPQMSPMDSSAKAEVIAKKLNRIAEADIFDQEKGKIFINDNINITDKNKEALKQAADQYIGQYGIDNKLIEDIEPPVAG